MKREYAADTLKWNLTDLLTKEKDRATLDFLCECVDFLLKQPKPDTEVDNFEPWLPNSRNQRCVLPLINLLLKDWDDRK